MKKAEIAANAGFLGFAVGAIFTAICYEADKKHREEFKRQRDIDHAIDDLRDDIATMDRRVQKTEFAMKEKDLHESFKAKDSKRPGKELPRCINRHH